jgi:predicted nuclease of predicted toxin-antitoxin system
MRFLVDAQLPPALCRWLEARDHEAAHVADILSGATPDIVIADYAESGGWILVTKDDDFLTLRLPDRFTLLWLRCGNATNRALSAWLKPRWPEIERLLGAGERMIEVR